MMGARTPIETVPNIRLIITLPISINVAPKGTLYLHIIIHSCPFVKQKMKDFLEKFGEIYLPECNDDFRRKTSFLP
jgi:hypothetical protein